MARFTTGCLVLDPTGLSVDELLRLFEFLKLRGLPEANVLIRSSPVYALNVERRVKDVYVVPQGSLIICSLEPSFPLGKLYVLDKDAWLDVKKVDLVALLHLFETFLKVSSSCLPIETRVGEFVYRFECFNDVCRDMVILDYISMPLFWLSTRRGPLDESYQALLNKVFKPIDGLHVFAFIQTSSGFEALTGFRREGGFIVFAIRVIKGCQPALKYTLWFIIDTLLK